MLLPPPPDAAPLPGERFVITFPRMTQKGKRNPFLRKSPPQANRAAGASRRVASRRVASRARADTARRRGRIDPPF
jgi:hypothetical protein